MYIWAAHKNLRSACYFWTASTFNIKGDKVQQRLYMNLLVDCESNHMIHSLFWKRSLWIIFLFYWCSSQRTPWELWLLTDWIYIFQENPACTKNNNMDKVRFLYFCYFCIHTSPLLSPGSAHKHKSGGSDWREQEVSPESPPDRI